MTDIAPRELTAKLERIATYEQRFRKTPVTAFLRWAGHTRAFATIYRRIGPLIDPWLSRITQGELAARIYGIPALLLTTTGARTGRSRVSPCCTCGADKTSPSSAPTSASPTTPHGPRTCCPTRKRRSKLGPCG